MIAMARLSDWWAIGAIPWLSLVLTGQIDSLVLATAAAVPTGFLLQQLARFELEVVERAFDHSTRPALALIRTRLGTNRQCSAKAAYRIYEVAFYRHPDWSAARAHVHRCWHWVIMLRAATLATLIAAASAVFAAGATTHIGGTVWFTWVLSAAAAALIAAALWRKANHTKKLLHEFDCGWIVAHWPAYEEVAAAVLEQGEAESTQARN